MRRFITIVFLAMSLLITAPMAKAVTFLRDAEVERGLSELARPILLAAGLNPSSVRIILIDDENLNAFVIDGRAIFIHSGLVMKLQRPEELQAVIAHEAAHIANGHMTRRMTNFQNARLASAISLGVAIAAGAAGADPDVAGGIAMGGNASARGVFLGHTRSEEASADESGVRYMVRAGVDPNGAVTLLEIFKDQEYVTSGRQNPYARTHPLSSDRYRRMQGFAASYKGRIKPNPQAEAWFAIVQGKLSAFKRSPRWTLRRVGNKSDQVSVMRRAVAYHRQPNTKRAISEINRLVAVAPSSPYVHELKGQILLESRQFQAAVNSYGKAVNLAPNQPLILSGYGKALLALDTRDSVRKALPILEKARSRDPYNPRVLRDLGVAYAKTGQRGMASLVTAESYALRGRLADAGIHAKRAADLLPNGSASARRAQDILRASEGAKRQRNGG
ncbi:M48 family metalloprotease [Parasulfitobacter algicola]|uniref:M48 family metalloprotease n=1 Tax=Parasulfitobacter algicola TaxID=2614809 RepID=A0ABX2IYR3_9RHOB|nr:M48 family metalloprotease [Sulfitobacter algicola]NSX55776.1 M48 family metalloprotease [Sulfitobacter algicola]